MPANSVLVQSEPEHNDTFPYGLSAAEAAERLARSGPNRLPEPRTPSLLLVFLAQFRSPLIYILLIAAAVSFSSTRPRMPCSSASCWC